MILELISFFTGRRIIYLQDFQGEIYKTLEGKKNIFDNNQVYIHYLTKNGCVTLNNDGTVSDSFIIRWRYKYE